MTILSYAGPTDRIVMRLRSFLFAIAVLLIAATSAAASPSDPASREDVHEHEEDGLTIEDPSESLRGTAELLASSAGGTVDDALTVLEHQDYVDQLVKTVVALAPNRYGGAYSDGYADISSTILIKGGLDKNLQSQLGDIKGAVVFRDTPFSLAELEKLVQTTHSTLASDGFKNHSVGIDTRHQRIQVNMYGGERLADQTQLDSLVQRVADTTGIALSPAEVSVHEELGGGLEPETFYGGDRLYWGSSPWCSTAFSATRNSNGTTGVLSANHCNNSQNKYRHWSTYHTAAYAVGHGGWWGDFEFLTVNSSLRDDFWVNTSTRYDVHSVQPSSQVNQNDWYCFWGRASGSSTCEQVLETGIWTGTYGNIVRTTPAGSVGGDSGSPWYSGGKAVGVHHGSWASNGDAAFSLAVLAESTLGVTIAR